METVSPDGQFIKIDQVRGVTNRLALIPFEATKRVVVFSEAGRMNPQAANALRSRAIASPNSPIASDWPTRFLKAMLVLKGHGNR